MFTNVSKKHTASIFRAEEQAEQANNQVASRLAASLVPFSSYPYTLKMETVNASEMSVNYQTTGRHITDIALSNKDI
jgi:hypothetical protein